MSRSILIVDDDPRILASLSQALTGESSDVRTADTAELALSRLGEAWADVVLADLKMPGMDGMELLKLLRQRSPDIDVLIMTAYDDLPTVAEAMLEGASDFLVKPLDLHLLRRVLERVFEDREVRSQLPETARAGQVPVEATESVRIVGRDPAMWWRCSR